MFQSHVSILALATTNAGSAKRREMKLLRDTAAQARILVDVGEASGVKA